MRTRIKEVFAILTVLFLAACSVSNWNDKLSTPAERALGAKFVSAAQVGNLTSIQENIDPRIFTATKEELVRLRPLMPVAGKPELVTVNVQSRTENDQTTTLKSLNYEVGSEQKWAVFQVTIQTAPAGPTIVGWRINPVDAKPTKLNDFAIPEKSPLHFLFAAAIITSVLTCLTGAIVAYLDRANPRRWLWTIGSLFGLASFSLNWTTGAVGFQPIYFALLGAGALKPSPFDPWTLTFSIPVFALIVLYRRFRLKQRMLDNSANA